MFSLKYLSDTKIFCIVNSAYARGGTRERFSPITGKKYPEGVDHDTADDELPDELTGRNLTVTKKPAGNQKPNTKQNERQTANKQTRRGNRPGRTSPYPPSKPTAETDNNKGQSASTKK